jgi:hypothetical protein
VPQTLSLLLSAGSEIGFFKLTSNQLANSTSTCVYEHEIKFLSYFEKTPGVLIGLSSENKIVLFEAKGKGGQFSCKAKAEISVPEGKTPTSIQMNSAESLMYMTF